MLKIETSPISIHLSNASTYIMCQPITPTITCLYLLSRLTQNTPQNTLFHRPFLPSIRLQCPLRLIRPPFSHRSPFHLPFFHAFVPASPRAVNCALRFVPTSRLLSPRPPNRTLTFRKPPNHPPTNLKVLTLQLPKLQHLNFRNCSLPRLWLRISVLILLLLRQWYSRRLSAWKRPLLNILYHLLNLLSSNSHLLLATQCYSSGNLPCYFPC